MNCHSFNSLIATSVVFRASAALFAASPSSEPPYPHSAPIESIVWHWETRATAALGSDLWPVAWGPDDHLYGAWGDGGGFGGSDSDGRVAMGIARIEGMPETWKGFNVNGGKNPEHPASFEKKGKTTGVAVVDGVLYATVNIEDGKWPEVDHVLAWSTDKGATWSKAPWVFPKGAGNFQPAKFLTFGRDYTGLPDALAGYVYLYGPKQSDDKGSGNRLYLARVPREKLRERAAYEFFQKLDAARKPVWVGDSAQAQPVFADSNGVTPGSVVYDPGLKRFLLTCFHVGPGQLGVFDAPNPWGPWTTIAYYEDWGGMGTEGEGLTCGFPQKWMSADGLTLWSIFSVYGDGAKQGINAHDKFNLIKATLRLRPQQSDNSYYMPYDPFAIQALFEPLGIEHWWFQYYDGGAKYGRHPSQAVGMPARDLARIAYCMLREGRWRDQQVIPKWFVDQTAMPSHAVTTPELRWKFNPQIFSLGWELPARHWGRGETGRSGQGIPADARDKPASGGQIIAFVPSLDLVVTRQTGSSGEWAFEEYLRRACATVLNAEQ